MNDPMVIRSVDSRSARWFASALVASSLWIIFPADAKTPQEIFAEVSPSIVVVEVSDAAGKLEGTGSGVVIAKGEVITNCHVAAEGKTLQIKRGDARYPATIHYADRDRDMCQLSAPKLSAPSVILGDVKSLSPGARVVAIGAPEGLELSISEGLISALRDYGDGSKIIQTTAAISPGSSGGGLFDDSGRLIGFTTFFLKEGQSLNFALPVNWIAALPGRAVASAKEKRATFDWFALSAALEEKKDWPALIALDRRWIQAEPKNWTAWWSLGSAYSASHQYAQAIEAEHEALRIDPEESVVLINLGNDCYNSHQYAEAIEAYRTLLRIDPKRGSFNNFVMDSDLRSKAWRGIGDAYDSSEQYAHAIEAFREALRIDPKNSETWFNLGHAYSESHQFAQAIEAYREALRIEPKDATTWAKLGSAYYDSHQYNEAAEACREALRMDPNDVYAWGYLGLAYYRQRNRSGVIEVYQALRTLDPEKADKLFDFAIAPH